MFLEILPNFVAGFFLAIITGLSIIFYFNKDEISEASSYVTICCISILGFLLSIGVFIIIFFNQINSKKDILDKENNISSQNIDMIDDIMDEIDDDTNSEASMTLSEIENMLINES